MLTEKYQFIAAVACNKNQLLASIQSRKLASDDIAHSYFVSYDGSKWANVDRFSWSTQAMCRLFKPANQIIAVSIDGRFATFTKDSKSAETISPEPYEIRNLTVIDGFAYACGMDRQVFKRTSEGKWVALHAPDSSHLKETHGFEAIAGFSGKDVYAVGWRGEIWHYNGDGWRQIDSPTNEILAAVVCADDGVVYIGGRNGILIRGRNNQWTIINNDGYNGDIWNMHYFNGKLYVATLECICSLNGDLLEPLDMGDDEPDTCYHLTSAEGVMWSVGTDDIFSFDGKKWTRIE